MAATSRNWIAAAGAMEHLDMEVLDYVPCYRSEAGTGVGMAFAVAVEVVNMRLRPGPRR